MANLTEVSQWENVIRQIENGEAATGGADGLANVQAKQLANRTKWLKDNLAPIVNAAFSGTLKHGNNDLAGSAIVAKSLSESGYIKYAGGLIIQWGRKNISSEQNITFPISFTSQYTYAFVHNTFGSSTQNYIKNQNTDMRADGITLTIADGAYTHIEWLAIGR